MAKLKPDYSFQEDAINNIIKDFNKNSNSKNLLVVPTGGGKTIIAIRTVNALYENGFLSKGEKVMWATHRIQLKKQTEDERDSEKNKNKFKFNKNLSKMLKVCMKDEARKILREDKEKEYKLLIIDEAHHSAANTYKKFFKKKIGILGLTATPTRTDESELEFEKISYSITFKELVRKGVIILPIFCKKFTGNTIYATSLNLSDRNTELDKFNTEARNQFIADLFFKNKMYNLYKKVVIFAGSNKHVKDLYDVIVKGNKFLNEPYEHIGYIYSGDNNEQNIDNDIYLKKHKQLRSSILINCRLLNEGYDDPSINTIVMATPTKSTLYYVQCVGRVVRTPKQGEDEKAYVLELMDDLPNIGYRIDNKWLFADISDYLEPIIIDEGCYDLKSFKEKIKDLLKNHNVDKKYFNNIPSLEDFENVSILLFNANSKIQKDTKWYPLFIVPNNRSFYTNVFNILSNNIKEYYKANHDYLFFDKIKIPKDDEYFKDRPFRVDFFNSLKKAFNDISNKIKVERLKYVTFTKINKYPDGFLEFIAGCYNEEYLKDEFNNLQDNRVYIIKFPLILGSYEGFYADEKILQFCKDFIEILYDIKNNERVEDHEKLISENISLLNNVPLPLKYLKSMVSISKDEIKNFYFNIGGKENE